MDARPLEAGRRRAVFLDKDGTLVENVPFNVSPDLIRPTPGALAAVRRLHEAGYLLIVVSNQPGVSHGFFPEHALKAVEEALAKMLASAGALLSGFYYCPHHPLGAVPFYRVRCLCRKPAPGLLYDAASKLNVDLGRSWLVGDILDDVEAGRRAGCRTVCLDPGGETEWHLTPGRRPDSMAKDLNEAADRILTGLQTVGDSNDHCDGLEPSQEYTLREIG